MQIDDAIKSRKSARKFSHEKPDWRDIIECVDLMRFAPMAGGDFSLKFILVSDREKIQKIAEACQQDFVAKAHYVLAVCSKPDRTINAYGKRGEIFARQQAGAAMQNFLLKIEEKKLATCWIGHFVESQIKHILEIKDGVNVEAIFPIGYDFEKIKPSKKINLDNVLYFEKYGKKKMGKDNAINV